MNKSNNISENDNLNDASFHKKGNPFKADNTYFEHFADKIQNRIDEYEELRTLAPLLSKISKYNPFDIPADYFEELPMLVQERCITQKNTKLSILDYFKLIIRPNFAIPFLVVGFIAFSGIKFLTQPTKNTTITEELSAEEHLYDIDEDLIVETLASNDAETAHSNNIEDYLIENNIDELNFLTNE